jgi:DNA repair protein RadC
MKILRELESQTALSSPDAVFKYLDEFKNEDREYLIVVGINTQNKPVYREIVAIGTLDSCIIHPREIFKRAIVMSCNSIIVAHNHPSGCSDPSTEDIKITRQLVSGGELLGIKVIDHLIITKDDYRSIIYEEVEE